MAHLDLLVSVHIYIILKTVTVQFSGHVLLHPKLRDPAETVYKDTIFPRLDLLEPSISEDMRNKILAAGTSNIISFKAQVRHGKIVNFFLLDQVIKTEKKFFPFYLPK
jgi:hypothetical protein